jgi:hypothetical protein
MDPDMPSYATFDLDILMSDVVHQFNDPVLEEIYRVLGVIEDYANQVKDDILIGYWQSGLSDRLKISSLTVIYGE